jgi:3-oxoacyl-[acyl-carrier protein] reductase
MTEEFWDTVLTTNLKSVFLCSHQLARLLDEQRKPGCIVNISTYGAARSQREMSAYNASKGGVEALTRAMALDLAPWGVRVNAVGPGPIATPSFLELFDTHEKRERMRLAVPLERLGRPEDIAGAVLYLASDDAAFVTGQVLYVDGGAVAQIRPPAYTPNLKRPR